MGYSGIDSSAFKLWMKAFKKKYKKEPTLEQAFNAGWEMQAMDHAGYDPASAIKQFGV